MPIRLSSKRPKAVKVNTAPVTTIESELLLLNVKPFCTTAVSWSGSVSGLLLILYGQTKVSQLMRTMMGRASATDPILPPPTPATMAALVVFTPIDESRVPKFTDCQPTVLSPLSQFFHQYMWTQLARWNISLLTFDWKSRCSSPFNTCMLDMVYRAFKYVSLPLFSLSRIHADRVLQACGMHEFIITSDGNITDLDIRAIILRQFIRLRNKYHLLERNPDALRQNQADNTRRKAQSRVRPHVLSCCGARTYPPLLARGSLPRLSHQSEGGPPHHPHI
jgi:hypothetical protein